jgi:NAD(P)H-dependent FMN reductase
VTRIGIILGSTRPNRNGEQVAKWVYDIASRRNLAALDTLLDQVVAWSTTLAPLHQPATTAAY